MPEDNILDLRKITRKSINTVVSTGMFNTHPEYDKMLPIWTRCRDAAAGEDAVKQKEELYLPRPSGMKRSDYLKYVTRGQYFNATGRTLEAYEGLIFRKDPIYSYKRRDAGNPLKKEPDLVAQETKDKLEKFFSSITNDGKSANQFLRDLTKEVMTVNKVGALIDFPAIADKDGNIPEMSIQEYEDRNLHPVASVYKAETILNWYWELIDTKIVPRFILLRENVDRMKNYYDLGTSTDYFRYRMLLLEDYVDLQGNPSFRYKQVVFESSDVSSYKITDVIYPMSDGKYINHIPFYIITDEGLDYRLNTNPMIFDLVNTNIGHYRNSADWENELHWVGIKTLYLAGWNTKVNGQPRLGGAMAGPAGSIPQLIEASSDSGIKDEMQKKEERMAVLGAERISQQGRYIASKETARINAQSESATLSTMSRSISESMSAVFTFLLKWAGEEELLVGVELNKDFYEDSITGEELLKWIDAYQGGGISFDAYYNNMDKREVFGPEWSPEKEKAALQESGVGLIAIGDDKAAILQDQVATLIDRLKKKGINLEEIEEVEDKVRKTNVPAKTEE